jgi:hypothetical protein
MESILTVTGAATNFNLTTLANFKTDIGLTTTDEDAWITAKLPRVSALIARFCNRVFAKQTYSQQFRDVESDALSLSQYPIVSVTSITEDGTVLASTDYEIDAAKGLIYRLYNDERVCWSACKITVVYLGGFVLPGDSGTRDLPQDLEEAALTEMKSARLAKTRDPAVKSYDIPGVYSETRWIGDASEEALSPDVCAKLQTYRRLDR